MTDRQFRDAVLVVAHAGSMANVRSPDGAGGWKTSLVGIVMEGCTLPIATARPSTDDDGFAACWQAERDVEAFFRALDINYFDAPGLWVVETRYCDADVSSEEDRGGVDEPEALWAHLAIGMEVRLPTAAEMTRVAEGLPPWEGGEWL